MSNLIEDLEEIQKEAAELEFDFNIRTEKMIEIMKRKRSVKASVSSKEELALFDRYLSILEDEYKKSYEWFPIDKIEEGLDEIESHDDFNKEDDVEWREKILY